jgi:hypothetical protein
MEKPVIQAAESWAAPTAFSGRIRDFPYEALRPLAPASGFSRMDKIRPPSACRFAK